MMLRNKLVIIRDLLVGICPDNCYHYYRTGLKAPYCIWAEDMEPNQLYSDNVKIQQSIHGVIDYFTKTEFDSVIDQINDALNENPNLTSFISIVEFEEDTNLIHYQWEFEVM